MVQPSSRFRLPDTRTGHAGHLRAHGNAAALRSRGVETGADRPSAVRRRAEGPDGGRSASGRAGADSGLSLRIPLYCAAAIAAAFLCAQAAAADLSPLTVETASGAHSFQVEVAADERSRMIGLMH